MEYTGNVKQYNINYKGKIVGKITITKSSILPKDKISVILIHIPLEKEILFENAESKYYIENETVDIDGLVQRTLLKVYDRDEIFNFSYDRIN